LEVGHVPSGLAALADREPVATLRMSSETARTDILTYADGSKAVRKAHDARAASIGDPVAMCDAEELVATVHRALGLRAAEVHRADPTTIYLEYVDGRRGDTVAAEERDATAGSEQGRLLGLAHLLTEEPDCNNDNWFIDTAERLVAVDHGSSFQDWAAYGQTCPPTRFVRALSESGSFPLPAASIRERLLATRPAFERLGRLAWWQAMLARAEALTRRPVTSPSPAG
jgi:hypothetical protein